MGTDGLRFSIVLGQRLSWPEMLVRALETERLGFDGLFLVDHFYGLKDLDDPTHEAYTMLAALAPFTQQLKLGVMVSGNTYRNPAFLLKQAITVDHVSGGRVVFGVGAGWVEREHEAYGWEFPAAGERVDRFAEALEIWDALQARARTTYLGKHYRLVDAPFEPKSLQRPRLPLLIGGSGPRMLRLAATHADIWNTVGTPDEAEAASARMHQACVDVGRDFTTLARSVSPTINLLASREAFFAGAAAYHRAGMEHIYFPWPRVEEEVPVLREVAREIFPSRGEAHSGIETEVPRLTPLAATSPDQRRDILSSLDGADWRLLEWLCRRPDERFDGTTIMGALGISRHVDVTLAFVRMAEAFHAAGVERPWNEAQRGYLVPGTSAESLLNARPTSQSGQVI